MSISRGWHQLAGVILVLGALAGCSPGPPAAAGAPGSASAPGPNQTSAATTGPAAALSSAISAIQAAAEFETTVSVDGAVVLTSTGRSVANASSQSVTSEGRTVEYIHVPPSAWVRVDGGSWVLLTADEAPGSPLDVLASPDSVHSLDASATSLTATYPAEALGLTGDPITVSLEIDGSTITARYDTLVGDRSASSVTVMRPSTSTAPIVPPDAVEAS
jgi:hypothetical protein